MKIKQAIQIGDNVTDIMKLPCVTSCVKHNDGNGFEWLVYMVECGADGSIEPVEKHDWLVEDENGIWHAMTDEGYRQIKSD